MIRTAEIRIQKKEKTSDWQKPPKRHHDYEDKAQIRDDETAKPKKAQSSESLTTVHKHHINALTRSGNGRSRSYLRVPKAKLSLVRALQSNLISFFNGK